MISGVDSLMPLTHLAHPLSQSPYGNPLFVLCLRVSYVLSPPCFYIIVASIPFCSSVLYLKFLT